MCIRDSYYHSRIFGEHRDKPAIFTLILNAAIAQKNSQATNHAIQTLVKDVSTRPLHGHLGGADLPKFESLSAPTIAELIRIMESTDISALQQRDQDQLRLLEARLNSAVEAADVRQ